MRMNSRLEGMENPKCCVCAPAEHDDAIIGIGEKGSLNSKVSISAPHSKLSGLEFGKFFFFCVETRFFSVSLRSRKFEKICAFVRPDR